jgi:hypothetical protein
VVSEVRPVITDVLEVIAAPPPKTGVAETVKLLGAAPQFEHPTVSVAEVSAIAMAEMVAIGLGVVTVVDTVALVWPLKVTDARIVWVTFEDKAVKLKVVVAEVAVPEMVLGAPFAGVIEAT